MQSNGYPLRRHKGVIDENQLWISTVYRQAIRQVIEDNPGLNTSQIAARLPEARKMALRLLRQARDPDLPERELPPIHKGELRKTVRKHLKEMLEFGQVKKVGITYYLDKSRISTRLVEPVNKLLAEGDHQDWSFSPDVAVYRTYIDPSECRNRIDDFFDAHIPRFADSLFFLDKILEGAIGSGHLSPDVYNSATDSINIKLLRRGWRSYFGNAKLIALAYAVDLPNFLNFLETPEGEELAKRLLAKRWDSILTEGTKKLVRFSRLARIREVRAQLREKK